MLAFYDFGPSSFTFLLGEMLFLVMVKHVNS